MNKTIKLYDFSPYETSFTGKVTSISRLDENNIEVLLDKTMFFPEEGGQSPDKGNIDGYNVKNVQIKNDIVSHTIECNNDHFAVGKEVYGNVDWDYRFSNMQNHSAEHIFSGLVNKKYGYNNSGFHLSDNIVTMDFDGPLSAKDIAELEADVNDVIHKNIKTNAGYPEPEELKKLEYRSKIDLESGVRIVEMGPYDKCACCAPHVSRTGEIGIFKVQSIQSYKGGVRISYLAGKRALNAYINDFNLLERLCNKLSANRASLEQFVDNLKLSNDNLKLDLVKADTFRLEIEVDKQKNNSSVLIFDKDIEATTVRKVANNFTSNNDKLIAIFIGDDETAYKYVVASNTVDTRNYANILREKFDAKGGGPASLVQGTVNASKADIEKIFNYES